MNAGQQIRAEILYGKPFTMKDMAEKFGCSQANVTMSMRYLEGQGATFEKEGVGGPGNPPKTFRMTKLPTHPERPIREALAIARAGRPPTPPRAIRRPLPVVTPDGAAVVKPGAEPHKGWLAGEIRDRLERGEQHSVDTLMALLPGYSQKRMTSTFNSARESLRKRGHKLIHVKGTRPFEKLWFLSKPAKKAQEVEVIEPPRKPRKVPTPPPFGALVEITAMAKLDGELNIVISENGNSWSCVVVGHSATQH